MHFLLSFISSLDFKPLFVPIEANSRSVSEEHLNSMKFGQKHDYFILLQTLFKISGYDIFCDQVPFRFRGKIRNTVCNVCKTLITKTLLDMKDNSKCFTISLPTSIWSHCFVGIEANSGSDNALA